MRVALDDGHTMGMVGCWRQTPCSGQSSACVVSVDLSRRSLQREGELNEKRRRRAVERAYNSTTYRSSWMRIVKVDARVPKKRSASTQIHCSTMAAYKQGYRKKQME